MFFYLFILVNYVVFRLQEIVFYIYKKAFLLSITMQFVDISARLTLQVTTIICYHMKKVLLKTEKRKKIIKKYMEGLNPKSIC